MGFQSVEDARTEKKPHSRLCGLMEKVRVSQLTGMDHYAHRSAGYKPMSRPNNRFANRYRKRKKPAAKPVFDARQATRIRPS
jgi:hypothetical protein